MSTHGSISNTSTQRYISSGNSATNNRPMADVDDTIRRTKLQLLLNVLLGSDSNTVWFDQFNTMWLTNGTSIQVFDSTPNILLIHNNTNTNTYNVGFAVSYLQLGNEIDKLGSLTFSVPSNIKSGTQTIHLAILDLDPFVLDPSTHKSEQLTTSMAISQEAVAVNRSVAVLCLVSGITIPTGSGSESLTLVVPTKPGINTPVLYQRDTILTNAPGESMPLIEKHLDWGELRIPTDASSDRQLASKRLIAVFYSGTKLSAAQPIISTRNAGDTAFQCVFTDGQVPLSATAMYVTVVRR